MMAKGFDELLEFVLGEIALCGDRGASIADFRRFVQEFYKVPDLSTATRKFGTQEVKPVIPDQRLTERVWGWLKDHPDFVVKDGDERANGTLEEIESDDGGLSSKDVAGSGDAAVAGTDNDPGNDSTKLAPKSTTEFRMYASEDRVWKAIAGHSIDYKRIPILEFECLQVICARGPKGIIQPDLTTATGQDKRSTPKRTDNLAEKGYIEKRSVNVKGFRTTLCTHKRYFAKEAAPDPTGPGDAAAEAGSQHVFINGRLIIDNLVNYLYELLKDIRIITQNDLRKKLDIPGVKTWQGKALEGALTRLKNIDYISRTKARVQGRPKQVALCVKLLRAPTDEDHRVLSFGGHNRIVAETVLEEDQEGDDDLRDLDLEAELVYEDDEVEEVDRIPPQWTPDWHITNFIFEAIDAAGMKGINSMDLRIASLGKFWKRPVESILVRLTDTWEKNQPSHLKHFSVIRDTAITQERKSVHYIFRSYGNFQKAVDAGETEWAAVLDPKLAADKKKSKGKKPNEVQEDKLDEWGFPVLSPKLFTNGTGAASLQECRESMNEAVMTNHWDNGLLEKLGYRRVKPFTSTSKSQKTKRFLDPVSTKIPALFQKRMGQDQGSADGGDAATPGPETHSMSPAVDGLDVDTPIHNAARERSQPINLISFVSKNGPVRRKPTTHREDGTAYLNLEQLRDWRLANGFKVTGRLSIPAREMLEEQGLIPPRTPKKTPKKGKKASGASVINPLGALGGKKGSGKRAAGTGEELMMSTPTPALVEESQSSQVQTPALEDTPSQATVALVEQLSQPGAELNEDNDNSQLPSAGLASANSPDNQISPAASTEDRLAKRIATPTSTATFTAVNIDSGRPRKKSRKEIRKETLDDEEDLEITPAGRKRRKYRPWRTIAAEHFERNGGEDTITSRDTSALVSQDPISPALESIDGLEATEPTTSIPATPGQSFQSPSTAMPARATIEANVTAQVQAILTRFNDRSEPGVYVNPFATRRIARGRPRRALIAVFKSDRIRELGLPSETPPPLLKQAKEPKTSRQSVARGRGNKTGPGRNWRKPFETGGARGEPEEISGQVELDVPENVGDHENVNQMDILAGTTSSAPLKRKASPAYTLVDNGNKRRRVFEEPYDDANKTIWPDTKDTATEEEGTRIATDEQSLVEPETVSHILEEAAQTDSVVSQLPASSPEGPPQDVQMADATTPVGSPPPPASSNPQFPGIPDAEIVKRAASGSTPVKRRGVVLGGGSVFHKRTRIILDMITRCGGMFPGSNELYYVFIAMWEKSSDLKKTRMPDRTTILKQLKVLISNGTVQHLQFSFKAEDGKLIVKQILTLADVDPLSVEVKTLQKHMIEEYPSAYYPDQVSEFAVEIRARGPHRKFEIETELAVEPLFPSEVYQRLEARIQQTREEREKEAKEKNENRNAYFRERYATKKAERMRELQQQALAQDPAPTLKEPRGHPVRLPKLHNDTSQYLSLFPSPMESEIDTDVERPPRYMLSSDSSDTDENDDAAQRAKDRSDYSRHGSNNSDREFVLDDDDTLGDTPSPISLSSLYNEELDSLSSPLGAVQHSALKEADGSFVNIPAVSFYPNIGIFSTDEFVLQRLGYTELRALPRTKVKPTKHLRSRFSSPVSVFHQPTGTFSTVFHPPGYSRLPFLVNDSEQDSQTLELQRLEIITTKDLPTWEGASQRFDKEWMTVPEHAEFFTYVNRVATWEVQHLEKPYIPESNRITFIHHSMPGEQVLPDRPEGRFYEGLNRRGNRKGLHNRYYDPGSLWIRYQESAGRDELVPFKRARVDEDEESSNKKRRVTFDLDVVAAPKNKGGRPRKYPNGQRPRRVYPKRTPKPRVVAPKGNVPASVIPKTTLSKTKPKVRKAVSKAVDPNAPKPNIRRTRRARATIRCIIDNEATDKLLYTVIVSKVLAGGIEQNIDWKVVWTVFADHPNLHMDTFHKRWNAIKSRCKALIDRLTEQFQHHFIEAYEKGEAPTVDPEDPDSYDWVELVDWARDTLKASSRSILLPEDRREIDDGFIVEELIKHTDFHDHWHDVTMQTYIRQEEVADFVYSVPIKKPQLPKAGDQSTNPELLRAKSWIRASIANAAPPDSESAKLATEKLSTLGESYIDEALSALRGDGAFKVLKKGRDPLLGDAFTLSPAFYKSFKRVWDVENFRDAVLFKQQLDGIFSAPPQPTATTHGPDVVASTAQAVNPHATYPIPTTTPDGALMVILTLLASRRAKLTPQLPAVNNNVNAPFPRLSVWGWTSGNYRAVAAPREHIFWGLDLVPTPLYRFGNCLAADADADVEENLPGAWDVAIAPPPSLEAGQGRIPLWYDLEGKFVYAWWERAVSAVLQLIVLRAPSSRGAVAAAVVRVLERWEVELVVGWLVEIGAVREEAGERIVPGEWWWCVFGDTEEGRREAERRGRVVQMEAEVVRRKPGPKGGRRRRREEVPVLGDGGGEEWDGALLELAGVGGEESGEGEEDTDVDVDDEEGAGVASGMDEDGDGDPDDAIEADEEEDGDADFVMEG